MRERIGRYRITGTLGEGGMGIVYAVEEEPSGLPFALKLLRQGTEDTQSRKRFLREARLMEAVVHPNVCRVHEIGEDAGDVYIATERLDGVSLAERVRRGALPLAEGLQVALGILTAVEALHAKGLVHRDLKPANVYLTPAGVKLLDFGLARPVAGPGDGDEEATRTRLTQAGTVLGTPYYMSPEQMQGHPADARSDLFAAAAILFEMLTGRPAFAGRTMMAVFHATLYENPPALGGSPGIAAVDRVIRRALSKRPEDRHPRAADMAQELRAALLLDDAQAAPLLRAVTRIIVLPFRLFRPDPETDFLAFSLPDSITSSLSGLESLVVRSSMNAARFAGDAPDLKRIAAEADVDIVLSGSLLRAGDQIRVTAQLVEAPAGAVIWSQVSTVGMQDVFRLEDEFVQRIVGSLSVSLTAREHRMLRRDVPATASAYEFYLRANQHAYRSADWGVARDLYLRCVDEDPRYAPAWARLGRVRRLLAKYSEDGRGLEEAEAALRRALELNPELPFAHNMIAHLEADLGRAPDAMTRLLGRAKAGTSDPELFAGLVHVCRYCGLFDASVAAHHEARRLDPQVRTSVAQTYFMMGDYERVMEESAADIGYIDALSLAMRGREAEALALLRDREARAEHRMIRLYIVSLRAVLEGRREDALRSSAEFVELRIKDPEALYYMCRQIAHLGEPDFALRSLQTAVEDGFCAYPALARDPWLDSLRTRAEFNALAQVAEARWRQAQAAFRMADGERLLGLPR